MKVRCTRNKYLQNHLTIGKVYSAIQNANWYILTNDIGVEMGYQKSRFETVEEDKPIKKENGNMSLKDKVFQNHMEVELRNGEMYIVVNNQLVFIKNANRKWLSDCYNDNLIDKANSAYDIVKVTNPFTSETVFDRARDMIDWSRVEVDVKVLVRSNSGEWLKRHFARYNTGKIYTWEGLATSFTSNGNMVRWNEAKLYKED